MPTVTSCPSCKATLRVANERPGIHIKCPQCGSVMTMPSAASPERARLWNRRNTVLACISAALLTSAATVLCACGVVAIFWDNGEPQRAKQKALEVIENVQRNRSAAVNNLKQIGIAIHKYNDVNKCLPPAAIGSDKKRDGKPLLSWRVAILPYIGQESIYAQFDLDEPWDHPTNKKLIPQMPPAYMLPGADAMAGMTHYLALVDPNENTAHTALRTRNVNGLLRNPGNLVTGMPDGASNTIIVAEAREPTIWTKPEDLPFDWNGPLPHFGIAPDGFNALLGDASVRFIRFTISEQTLRLAILPNDGNPLPADWNSQTVLQP